MIGGIQLFDAAQIYTQGTGGPDATSYTIMMYLSNLISGSRNYGISGALSVILFIITGILSIFVYKTLIPSKNAQKQEKRVRNVRNLWLRINNKEYAEGALYESRISNSK
jgi:ABC-type sugar transport systems, permease components